MNLVDSCGWLEYFAKGRTGHIYKPVIQDCNNLIVPTICLYEVYRRMKSQVGIETATDAFESMREGIVVDLDPMLAAWAVDLGIEHKLPLADSVILATARAHNATIWTQDEHFRHIDGVRFCEP